MEDWERRHIYLPDEVIGAAGARQLWERRGEPLPRELSGEIGSAVQRLLAQAAQLYRSGDTGVRWLSWRCALSVRTARYEPAVPEERVHGHGQQRVHSGGEQPVLGALGQGAAQDRDRGGAGRGVVPQAADEGEGRLEAGLVDDHEVGTQARHRPGGGVRIGHEGPFHVGAPEHGVAELAREVVRGHHEDPEHG